jgi:hypothetical protein
VGDRAAVALVLRMQGHLFGGVVGGKVRAFGSPGAVHWLADGLYVSAGRGRRVIDWAAKRAKA